MVNTGVIKCQTQGSMSVLENSERGNIRVGPRVLSGSMKEVVFELSFEGVGRN